VTDSEDEAVGRRGRRACQRQVAPRSPPSHDLCGALRSTSGPHPCCFAVIRTGNRKRAQRSLRPEASTQEVVVTKGSPDSGARCAGRKLACVVRDERRAGSDRRAKISIGRTLTQARISQIVLCPPLTVFTRTVWTTSCNMRSTTVFYS